MSFVIAHVILPLLTGTTIVYAPAGLPPTASTVADVLSYHDISLVTLTPLTLMQIHRDPALLDRIAGRVRRVVYSGGDIPAAAGDALSQRLEIRNAMASTECGLFHGLLPASLPAGHAWHSLAFHPSSNVAFVQREGDIYEAVVRRKESGYTQPVFRIFPEKTEYATGDLYRRNGEVEGLWEHQGRGDDMVVFASGEKFWPVDVERGLAQHAHVNEALIVGTGRERAALLLDVECTQGMTAEEAVDEVWPAIEATHSVLSPAARVLRAFIIVVDAERPFVKTPKGNVQRGTTAKLYAGHLARLDSEAAERGIAAPAAAVEMLTDGVQL
jgi:acyl-coenzyme A synthetase/AMP-(fatty) acid ligase